MSVRRRNQSDVRGIQVQEGAVMESEPESAQKDVRQLVYLFSSLIKDTFLGNNT